MNITILLPAERVGKLNGIPITLKYDTAVVVNSANVPLLFEEKGEAEPLEGSKGECSSAS